MKIKNLICIFGVTLGIIFFISGISFGADCVDNPNNPNLCSNPNGESTAYNNSNPVTDSDSLVYLKMFHNGDNLSCTNNNQANTAAEKVRSIQQSMKNNCPNTFQGCIDGRFGITTETALKNCAQAYCANKGDNYIKPTLDGNDLKCDTTTHEFDDTTKCCKPKPPEPTCDHPKNDSGLCDTGYKEDPQNTGCCIIDCGEPQECTGAGEIWSEASCKCVCDSSVKCCGIKLNTVVPFIGDCIELGTDSSRSNTTSVNSVTAFPILVQGLMKIIMSVIMVFSFIMVILSGLLMTTGAFSNTNFDKGKNILKNVIISLILLGSSGLILSLINPSFFGG